MLSTETAPVRRFLWVLWDGGGNVPPQLAIARALVARGHEVRILAPRALEARIVATGCRVVPYRQAPEHDSTVPERDLLRDWAARTPLEAGLRTNERLMTGPALAFARDVLATLEEEPADIVATDFLLLGSYLAAERAALPLIAFFHSVYPLPLPGVPPFGFGFTPARNAPARLRDRLFTRLFARIYGAGLDRVNAARDELGLAPLAATFDLFASADRALVLTSRAFDFPTPALPAGVRYIGAPSDRSVDPTPWQGPWAHDDRRPLVVASLSTTVQRQEDVLRRIIAALGTMPVRGLVTVGPSLDPAAFPAPANVAVARYIPHARVFPQADLVITHGGHGTTIAALACGVPLLCLPMGRDQGDIAARVAWHGAGLSLGSKARSAALRRAIARLLEEPQFRAGARRIADDLAREDATATAVEELETLAARRSSPRAGATA